MDCFNNPSPSGEEGETQKTHSLVHSLSLVPGWWAESHPSVCSEPISSGERKNFIFSNIFSLQLKPECSSAPLVQNTAPTPDASPQSSSKGQPKVNGDFLVMVSSLVHRHHHQGTNRICRKFGESFVTDQFFISGTVMVDARISRGLQEEENSRL